MDWGMISKSLIEKHTFRNTCKLKIENQFAVDIGTATGNQIITALAGIHRSIKLYFGNHANRQWMG